QLYLIWIPIKLNVAAELAAPAVAVFLIEKQTLVEEVRAAPGRSDDSPRLGQRTAGRNNRHVWITENILAGAEFKARDFQAVRLECEIVFVVEAIETVIVVEKERGIVRELFMKRTRGRLSS